MKDTKEEDCTYSTFPMLHSPCLISISITPFSSTCSRFSILPLIFSLFVDLPFPLVRFHPLCFWYLPFTIHHHGYFHSVRRNPSLKCFHRRRSLAILGHAGPRWRITLSLHVVLGLPCRLVHSRGVHSVTLLVHNVVVESCNVSRPSMYSLLDNVYDVIYTCLMSYPGITFVVTYGNNAEHDALHFALCD